MFSRKPLKYVLEVSRPKEKAQNDLQQKRIPLLSCFSWIIYISVRSVLSVAKQFRILS